MATGIDRAQKNDLLEVTVQVAKPMALQQGTQGGPSNPSVRSFWLVSSTGRTVFEAVRNFLKRSPWRLYWPHNRLIVFGEEAAREGIGAYIDFFVREPETRVISYIMVVKGARASDFMEAEFETEPLPSEGLFSLVKAESRWLSTSVEVEFNDFLLALEEEGIEPVAMRAEIIERKKGSIVGKIERQEVLRSPRVTGAAVFKGDRLVGWLNKSETRGFLWIKGKAKGGIIVIEHPEKQHASVGIEMSRARSQVSPRLADGKIVMEIKIDAEGLLGDTQAFVDPATEARLISSMERRMAALIRNEITLALGRAQKDLGSDIFGFGAAVHRSFPHLWRDLKNRWDQVFPLLAVEIRVNAKIRRSGLSGRSPREE